MEGSRRTPMGSPIIKRIRRSQQKSLEKGRRLRSPDLYRKENILSVQCEGKTFESSENNIQKINNVNDLSTKKGATSSSWEDIRDVNLEFEDDFPIIMRNFNSDSCSDIFFNITDKIIPEGDDYKLVFISSSSSKSSGLNSLAGSCEDVSEGNDSLQGSSSFMNTSDEMMVYIEDGDWKAEQQDNITEKCISLTKDEKIVLTSEICKTHDKIATSDDLLTSAIVPLSSASYQEIVESLSPTHSVEEVETSDHVINIDTLDLYNLCFDSKNAVKNDMSSDAAGAAYKHRDSPLIYAYPLDCSVSNTQESGKITDRENSFVFQNSHSEASSAGIDDNCQNSPFPHPNIYFNRSDSTRSSGERSIEEVSFCDHVFPYSCHTESSEFNEYKSILNEIYTYMSQSCDQDKISSDLAEIIRNNSVNNPVTLIEGGDVCVQEGTNIKKISSDINRKTDCDNSFSTVVENDEEDEAAGRVQIQTDKLPTYLLKYPPCSNDENETDKKEWTYKVEEEELSSMTLQVNFSDAESQIDACSLDTNVEIQSVHCSVEDDALSVLTYVDNTSLDSLLTSNCGIISDSERSTLINSGQDSLSGNSFISHSAAPLSDKNCDTNAISLSESLTLDKAQNSGNVYHQNSSKEIEQSDSQVQNGDNDWNNESPPSIFAHLDPDSKELLHVGSSESCAEDRENIATNDGALTDSDKRDLFSLEVIDFSQTRLKNKKSGSEVERSFFQAKEITIPCLTTDKDPSLIDKEKEDQLPSECPDICKSTPYLETKSSVVPIEKDSGNLVYYLAPQGTQSVYLVKSDSEKASTSELETCTVDINLSEGIDRRLLVSKSSKNNRNAALIDICTDEILSSDDRLESDTDSQDTVIEGEVYKRMRQLAVQKKILEANEDLAIISQSVTASDELTQFDQLNIQDMNECLVKGDLSKALNHPESEKQNGELVGENETAAAFKMDKDKEHKDKEQVTTSAVENSDVSKNVDFTSKLVADDQSRVPNSLLGHNISEDSTVTGFRLQSNQLSNEELMNLNVLNTGDLVLSTTEEEFKALLDPDLILKTTPSGFEKNINDFIKTSSSNQDSAVHTSRNSSSNFPVKNEISKSLLKTEMNEVDVNSLNDGIVDYINDILNSLIFATLETKEVTKIDLPEVKRNLNNISSIDVGMKDITEKDLPQFGANHLLNNREPSESEDVIISKNMDEANQINNMDNKDSHPPSLNDFKNEDMIEKTHDVETDKLNSVDMVSSNAFSVLSDDIKTNCKSEIDLYQDADQNISMKVLVTNDSSFQQESLDVVPSQTLDEMGEAAVTKNELKKEQTTVESNFSKAEADNFDQENTLSVNINELQELIAQSRKLTDSSNRNLDSNMDDNSISVLEKYYTLSLGGNNDKSKVGTGFNAGKSHGKLEDYFETLGDEGKKLKTDDVDSSNTDDDNIIEDGSSTEIDSCSEAVSEQWEFEMNEKLDESVEESDTTFSDSASSDEASFDREEELRGFSRTIDFSLHTIIEESCEESESERERRQKNELPQPADSSDLEKYFNFTIGNTTLPLSKRPSLAEESEFSDSFSETSSSVCSENLQQLGDDIDPAILASSRLEKYFMTGFLGLERNSACDDANGTDESGSIGSCSECSSITASASGSPSLEHRIFNMTANENIKSDRQKFSENKRGNISATKNTNDEKGMTEEESSEVPFEKNDGFDTIKRKKKTKSDNIFTGPEQDCNKRSCVENNENDSVKESSYELISKVDNEINQLSNQSDEKSSNLAFFSTIGNEENHMAIQNINSLNCDNEVNKEEETKKSEAVNLQLLQDENKNNAILAINSASDVKQEQNDVCLEELQLFSKFEMGNETPLPDSIIVGTSNNNSLSQLDKQSVCGLDRKQQSRDSGFIGSSDDLLKDSVDNIDDVLNDNMKNEPTLNQTFSNNCTNSDMIPCVEHDKHSESSQSIKKKVLRENSNSDDEALYIVGQLMDQISKGFAMRLNGSPLLPRSKPPDLVAFETELTKLMQTVPGVEVTVKEIVEELSSTDYYSDSYESSDYTSSDHEGPIRVSMLRRSLRSSLRSNEESRLHFNKEGASGLMVSQDGLGSQEMPKLDNNNSLDPDVPLRDETNSPFTRETIYIYEKLMSSLNRMTEQASKESSDNELPGNQSPSSTRSHPPMAVQVLQHIKERLTSLMREVHTGDLANSAKIRRNNSSSSSSSWLGAHHHHHLPLESNSNFHKTEPIETGKNYIGSLHANITRWLAKQPFNSGDEQSISSTSSINYESEDSPTDTEMSVESDDVASSPSFPHKDKKQLPVSLAKLDRKNGSDITIVDDDLSFRSLDTPETLFATHKIGEEVNPFGLEVKDKQLIESSLHCLKTLQDRGVMDLQYFVTQGNNNEYEVWQSLVIDEEKFKADSLASVAGTKGLENENRPLSRARHLLDSLKSSSSDTLQCISEEDLDSKPSSSRTSIIGSSTNIWSSQSSLAEKRGSLETLGCYSERYSQSPLPGVSPEIEGIKSSFHVSSKENIMFHKSSGLVTVDIPLMEKESRGKVDSNLPVKSRQNHPSFHSEIPDSGKFARSKEKVDFHSSLHLWVDKKDLETSNKPTARAMSADPLPQDCDWSNSRPFLTSNRNILVKQNQSLPFSAVSRTRPKAMIMSDNQLDKQLVVQSRYSTLTKSGPISVSPLSLSEDNVDPSRPKASTLPRIGADVHANVSFLHNNHGNHKTNTPPPPTAVPSHTKWSRSHPGELQNRKEIRSWPAEDMIVSGENAQQAKSSLGRRPPKPGMSNTLDGKTISIPQISVSDITELNPSGRSSYGSHGTNSDRESVPEEDIDRIVALHKTRSSLSSFGTRSDSMTSVYSAAGGGRYGTVVVRGEVLFSLSYNYKAGALEIMVKCCRDLAAVDVKRNRSDPYVKIYLLPDKSKSGKRKTKVKKHTLNPTFEEMLKFNVTISELETRTLWLTVWHSDMFGRNDFLGEVMLPLGYDVFDDPSPKWYPLQERLGPPEELVTYKGELNLSLTYMPPDVTTQKKGKQGKGSLHVLIKDARNLTAVRANGTSDPFCKSYLLPDKGKASKQKTQVIKKNCNPKWNHTFVYEDVSLDDLRERCLELTIWDYDRLTSNDFLGGVRLSLGTGKYQGKEVDWLDSRGEEVALWQTMLERPNTWVEGTLLLQPSMEKRS